MQVRPGFYSREIPDCANRFASASMYGERSMPWYRWPTASIVRPVQYSLPGAGRPSIWRCSGDKLGIARWSLP